MLSYFQDRFHIASLLLRLIESFTENTHFYCAPDILSTALLFTATN